MNKVIVIVISMFLLNGCSILGFKAVGDVIEKSGEAADNLGSGQLKAKTGATLLELAGVRQTRADTEQLQIKSDAEALKALFHIFEKHSPTLEADFLPRVINIVNEDRAARVVIAKQGTMYGGIIATAIWGVIILVLMALWVIFKHIKPKVKKATYS